MNRLAIVYAAMSVPLLSLAQEAGKLDPEREEQTRLQIFLDQNNFGPGKIDGKTGEFTSKALERYRKAMGSESPAPAKEGEKDAPKDGAKLDTTGLELQTVNPILAEYTITKDDVEGIGKVPKEPEDQAKEKSLPYETVLEAVAEKFHSDVDFIKELNPGAAADLKEGDKVLVPNVKPFELAALKDLKPGADLAEGDADAEKPKSKDKDDRKEDAKGGAASGVSVRVDVSAKMLEVMSDGKMLAAFPVTPGSDAIPTPKGDWKVKGVAKMPDFRRDEKLLKEGVRGDKAHVIPPGPNNPVGVVWIALNKDGIGIHGTNDPDTIGRAASHGCIRLANWDVAKLAGMVKGGVPVTVE